MTEAISNFHEVTSPSHFQDLLSTDLERVSLINFWAPWAAPCAQMNEVVRELARKYERLLVLQVEAEEQEDIAETFSVESVPSFIVLRGHTLLGRITGADAASLTKTVAQHLASKGTAPAPLSSTDKAPAAAPTFVPGEETPAQLEARLKALMTERRVMLFMKGTPDVPRCGFSRRAVALLRDQKIEFGSFDIFSDEAVRAGMKVVNNWPTFPQFVVDGEFIGGLDVVTEMVENGEFAEVVQATA